MSLGLHNYYGRYVYRVLRPDEDPYNITSLSPEYQCTIGQHVEYGLRFPSVFISTTSTLQCAYKWLDTANTLTSHIYGNMRTRIVMIDVDLIKQRYPNVARSAIDLTNWQNREVFLENHKQKCFAAAYNEIVFQYFIPPEAVNVVYTAEYSYNTNIIRNNPTYNSAYGQTSSTSENGGCCGVILCFLMLIFVIIYNLNKI